MGATQYYVSAALPAVEDMRTVKQLTLTTTRSLDLA